MLLVARLLLTAERNTRPISARAIWYGSKQFQLMRNAADSPQTRAVTSRCTPSLGLESAETYFHAMKLDRAVPRLNDCLEVTSMILKSQDTGDGRKGLLLEDVMKSMALSDGDVLLDKQSPEFYTQVHDLGEFYLSAGDRAVLVDSLAPLAARCLACLLDAERQVIIDELHPLLSFINNLGLHQSKPVSQALIRAKCKLIEIVGAVDDSDCYSVRPLMEVIVLTARSHAFDTRLRGWDLIDLAMERITPLMTGGSLLRLPRVISGREMGVMCTALVYTGSRNVAFMDAVAGALCAVVPAFPAALISWFSWSSGVLVAYSHLCVPAPRLAGVVVDFIERGDAAPFAVHATGVKLLRLCWALVVQGRRPPPHLVEQLTVVVQAYLLGRLELRHEVHKLPHVLFLLPEPWRGGDRRLAAQLRRDTLALGEGDGKTGRRVAAAAAPGTLLVDLLFPHAGLVTALGVCSAATGELVPYPPQLPCPTELPPGALRVLLGGCVGVAFLDVGMHDFLHPAAVLAGTIRRRKWLLERDGWCVCACDSQCVSGKDIVEMMQLKARLSVLETLAAVD